MKNLILLFSISLTWNAVVGLNQTDDANQNKTKRGIIDQTTYYGEPVTIKYIQTPIVQDSSGASATNFNFNNPKPIVFQNANPQIKGTIENEAPKQVTVQQVLYEYQQTPHNAVSNVHVNHQYQSSPAIISEQKYVADPIQGSQTQINPHLVNPHIIHTEPNQYSGVAAPVQHGTVIHHGQGYSKLLYGPFSVNPTTNPPLHHNGNTQAKYVFTNGKITYQPIPVNNHYPGIVLPARPQPLIANPHYPRPQQRPFKPSPQVPITYSRHQAHPKPQPKPAPAPTKEESEEEEDEKSNVREEQENEEEAEPEDHASYEEEEEEDFKPSYFSSKYKYDEDEDDNEKYQEEEEDEDNSRSPSRNVRKPKKFTRSESKPVKRYQKHDHYKYREGYKNKKHTEYKTPSEHVKVETSGKKPKNQYKSYYYKSSNNSKPKKDTIESHESEHVPVYHNKKFVHHEKWVVTKNDSD